LTNNPDAKILAGGYSLIPAMKLRLAQPGELVDLADIAELKGIAIDGDARIGAMTTYNQLRDHAGLAAAYPILPEAIGVIGDLQVREHGTFGGALAHNDPAADLTAVFLALNGDVTVHGGDGERTIPADELFVDLWTTTLNPDEIITHIRLPATSDTTRMGYEKHAHPASGYAIVGVAAVLRLDGDTVSGVRIAVTGATSVPVRAKAAEDALTGRTLDAESIAAGVSVVADGLDINGDHHATVAYRTHLLKVHTDRLLKRLAGLDQREIEPNSK
jgi:carbon-monoxide dehydrogenase medium subunit